MATKLSDNLLQTPPGGGGGGKGTEIDSGSHSGASSFDLTTGIDNTSQHYRLFLYGLTGGASGSLMGLRLSNDGGSSFRAASTDYSWEIVEQMTGAETLNDDIFDNEIRLSDSALNAPGTFGRSHNWIIDIFQPGVTNAQTFVMYRGVISRAGNSRPISVSGVGACRTAEANDAIRIIETAAAENFTCDYELWRM